MVVARGWLSGGRGNELFNGNRVSVLRDKKCSRDWLHNKVNIYLTLLDFSLKIGELVKIDIFYVIHIFTTIKNVCLFVLI